jgi:thioredoxin 1
MRSVLSSLLIISLLVGCSPQSSPLGLEDPYPALITLSTAEVAELASSTDQPVIVEFSVLHGCVRCAEMRPEVEKLASEQVGHIAIKRADFIRNQPLLQSLGATICPTYVLFTPDAKPQIHLSPQVLIAMADHPLSPGSP